MPFTPKLPNAQDNWATGQQPVGGVAAEFDKLRDAVEELRTAGLITSADFGQVVNYTTLAAAQADGAAGKLAVGQIITVGS